LFANSRVRVVVVVDLKVEEALVLNDEGDPAAVVTLDVADVALDVAEVLLTVPEPGLLDVLTEVEREALRVLEIDELDAEEPDEPPVVELGDPDVDEPGEPGVAVFQQAASRDCTSPTFR
jgi:hypothetical protein